MTITDHGIECLLNNLSTNKASGSDELPPIVLKSCAKELAPMLRGLSLNHMTLELYRAIVNLQMLFLYSRKVTVLYHLTIDPSPLPLYAASC